MLKNDLNKIYSNTTIEMRKASNKSFWMTIGTILLIVVLLLLFAI